jgi:hypothetical protein
MKHKLNLFHLSVVSLFILVAWVKIPKQANEISKSPEIKEAKSTKISSTNVNKTSRTWPCPEGTHAVLVYEFDAFRFHRPRYNCERGFWFCTSGGQWSIQCVPNSPIAAIEGGIANIWAEELGGQMELHFPLELKNTEGYTQEDLSTFNVDEEYEIYEGIILKPGDYSVTETENELVVIVDII